jgi:hypothetical protein
LFHMNDGELKHHLRPAKYAALTSRARTAQANALVDHLLAMVSTSNGSTCKACKMVG